jgi:hypothetical protein
MKAALSLCLAAFAAPALAVEKVTYVDHVLPIFRNACNNCHNPDKKKAGLDLTTYAAAMAGSETGAVVKPGQPDGSLLFKVCAHTEEPKMPPKGDKLTDAELALLKNWIAGFALETATSKPAKAAENQVSLAVVSLERPDGPPPMPGDLPLEPCVVPRRPTAITAMAASPWASLVAIGGQRQILLYHTETLQPLGVLPFPEGFAEVIRFSRNGQLLLTGGGLGGKSGKVVLWNVRDGTRAGSVGEEVDQVLAADLSPDHSHVALGGPSKLLKIFSTKDGRLLHTLKKHTDWVTAITFSPDGKFLASADRNGGVMVWEGATGKEYNALAGHKQAVTALAFMPGILASASTDGKITLWDVKEARELRSWNAHGGGVEWVDFTPDGRLVSSGRDKIAKVWDENGKAIFTSAPLPDIALRSALSAERVIAADWTGEIRAFALDGKPVGTLSSILPPIAQQIAAAEERFREARAALPARETALAEAEAVLKAEREAAAAKLAQEIAAAEKSGADARAAIVAAKARIATLEQHLAAASTPEQEAARSAAEKELDEAKKELPALVAAQEKIIAEADKRLAESKAPPAPPQPRVDEARIATLEKKLAELQSEIARRRETRGKAKEGTPDYAKANAAVQDIKPDITKAEAQLAEARKPSIQAPVLSPPEQAADTARKALEATRAALASAESELARWQRAQAFMAVYRAENAHAEMKSKHEDLLAEAKDAFFSVEQMKAQIQSEEAATAARAQKLDAAKKTLADAHATRDHAAHAAAQAEAVFEEKKKSAAIDPKAIEAEIAAAQAKLDQLQAEIAQRRETRGKLPGGSPEYDKANADVQAIKPDIANAEKALAHAKAKLDPKNTAPSPEVAAAEEALRKARAERDAAVEKMAAAEKAVAGLEKEAADASRTLAELRGRLPEMENQAAATKAKAEQEAAAFATEVERAKAEATRLRAEFEGKWRAADQRQASLR